jgi:AraC-like DNA-binding protein
LIDEALNNDDSSSLRLQDLAKKVNLTPRYLHKIFKDKTGFSPKEYAKKMTTERSSPSTMSTSTTTADGGNQSWDWDAFDFNDLVDVGTDSSPLNMNDFTMLEGHSSAIHDDLDFDMSSFLESWGDSYALDQSVSWSADPFLGLPATTNFHEAGPSVSTLELDAAVLFHSNSTNSL